MISSVFESFLIGGFDCGLVAGGTHDLLHTTGHLPAEKMRDHYRIAMQHGIRTFRDGLVDGHNPLERLSIAKEEGAQVIWDLSHYHSYLGFAGMFASEIAAAANRLRLRELWICPANEPEMAPHIGQVDFREVVVIGEQMIQTVRHYFNGKVRIMTSNASPSADERWSDPWAGQAEVVGLNVYPHTIEHPISDIIVAAYRRYGKPVAITETSWHDGWHHEHDGVRGKADWARYVLKHVSIAKDRGAKVAGVCWYPLIDTPPWEDRHGVRWSHGLIHDDLSVDPGMSEFFNERSAEHG